MIYVLRANNKEPTSELPTRVCLVGPFENDFAAADWMDEHDPDDDPWWQIVDLADTIIPKFKPEDADCATLLLFHGELPVDLTVRGEDHDAFEMWARGTTLCELPAGRGDLSSGSSPAAL